MVLRAHAMAARQSFLARLIPNARELGAAHACFYNLDRVLQKLGGFASIYRYLLVAQPVADEPLVPEGRRPSVEVRRVSCTDPDLEELEGHEAELLRYREGQQAVCFAAYRGGRIAGCLWLCFDAYDEDEVRCRFLLRPAEDAAWDFGIFVAPRHRLSLAFARLWDEANAFLRERGVRWTLSRISAFNPASLRSHEKLKTHKLGTATFLCVGRLQLMASSRPPFLHLSFGPKRVPHMKLRRPDPGAEG